jgi:hypothetical protein
VAGYATWGANEIGEVPRNRQTALPPWMHFRNVCYQVRAVEVIGFHAAIFLTGHYGPNWQDLKELLKIIQPHVGTRLCGLPDFEINQPGFDGDGRGTGDHAGKVETSLLWALEPECVDVSRIPAEGLPSPRWAMGANARQSSRRIGERMAGDEVRRLGARAAEMLAEYDRLKPAHTLRTFGDVERLWEATVRDALKGFRTMQQVWPDRPPVSKDSVWHPNSIIPELP